MTCCFCEKEKKSYNAIKDSGQVVCDECVKNTNCYNQLLNYYNICQADLQKSEVRVDELRLFVKLIIKELKNNDN